jgi:hypothetical protein
MVPSKWYNLPFCYITWPALMSNDSFLSGDYVIFYLKSGITVTQKLSYGLYALNRDGTERYDISPLL